MSRVRLEINLLPPVTKDQRRTRIYLQRIGSLLRVSIRMTIIVAVVLGVNAATYRYAKVILERNEPQALQTAESTKRLVAQSNASIRLADAWLGEYQPWTPLLRGFLGAVPGNISLTSLRLDEVVGGLVIRGGVTSRADVVNFKRQIEELEWVEEVQAPLSNFETGSEAVFSFTAIRK